MANCKTVWFSESDPEMWFEQCKDAERFDRAAEVIDHVDQTEAKRGRILSRGEIVRCIMERYNIEQRYDWAEPAKEDQDEADTI